MTDESNTGNAESITDETLHKIADADTLHDYAYGVVIGAAIGDSLGSYLEFSFHVDDAALRTAMKMPGGGTWGSRVKPGQVTDDSEMAMSLAKGIRRILTINKNKQNNKNVEYEHDSAYIAEAYYKWYSSGPFDMGGCTASTCSFGHDISEMKSAAFRFNHSCSRRGKGVTSGNLANGSLMRCTPLIVYGYRLSHQKLYALMTEDSSLTHANEIVYLVNTAYAIACQYLMTHSKSSLNEDPKAVLQNKNDNNNDNNQNNNNTNDDHNMKITENDNNNNGDGDATANDSTPNDNETAVEDEHNEENEENDDNDNEGSADITRYERAFLCAENWLCDELQNERNKSKNENENETEDEHGNDNEDANDSGIEREGMIEAVLEWLHVCRGDDPDLLHRATDHQGFLKIAFQRSFWHLWRNSSFVNAMAETVVEGGDTDTNACIVGGMMGALHGLRGIPKLYICKILHCKPAEPERDNAFQAKLYVTENLVNVMLENAPKSIAITEYRTNDTIRSTGFRVTILE